MSYSIHMVTEGEHTIDIVQFRLTQHCLCSAILASPQCSLRGPVGDSIRRFVVTHI
jgi:hypothetical protein